jgi:hypothetical protein
MMGARGGRGGSEGWRLWNSENESRFHFPLHWKPPTSPKAGHHFRDATQLIAKSKHPSQTFEDGRSRRFFALPFLLSVAEDSSATELGVDAIGEGWRLWNSENESRFHFPPHLMAQRHRRFAILCPSKMAFQEPIDAMPTPPPPSLLQRPLHVGLGLACPA